MAYVKGVMEGDLKVFSTDGKLLETTHFHEGEKDGKSQGWWEDKFVAWDENWQNGLTKRFLLRLSWNRSF